MVTRRSSIVSSSGLRGERGQRKEPPAAATPEVLHRELARERIQCAHRINLLRLWSVSTFFVLFLVLGGLLRLPAWQGNLGLFGVYWAVTTAVFCASRRSERVARFASLTIAVFDAPMVFFLQWATFPTSPSASGVAGFTVGIYVLLVILAALSLEIWYVLFAALVGAVFEIQLQHLAGVGLGAMVSTVILLGLAAAACSYMRFRLVALLERVDRGTMEQRRAESALRQAEALGRLADGVANELNTLMAAILRQSTLVYASLDDEPRQQRLLPIMKSARLAAKLASQLHAFSSRLTLTIESMNLGELVLGLVPHIQAFLPARISFTCIAAPEPWIVRADRRQIEGAIFDLVAIACDAMPDGGRLHVEVANVALDSAFIEGWPGARPGPHVAITVRDSRSGIDPEMQAHLFEPFFTLDGGGTGTGLGLPSVHGIVRQHGGYIEVDSTPGKGTAVRMYLPQASDEPEARPRVPQP
jgi:signal transduction histidine kinase